MTINDSSTLVALIKAYGNSIVFEESVPTAFRIAKAFCAMRWSNGGLMLLGVRADGSVLGVNPAEVDSIYERFERLCRELTVTRIEIGLLTLQDRLVVFLVLNPFLRNIEPLGRYSRSVGQVRFF
jgi:predicted HTH transcriptional regulator